MKTLWLTACLFAIPAQAEDGLASWYTGNGPTACPGGTVGPMTAAHRTLPCGTKVRVTRGVPPRKADLSVVVTITDRGPFVNDRIIDLSPDAAVALGMVSSGVVSVTVEIEAATEGPK